MDVLPSIKGHFVGLMWRASWNDAHFYRVTPCVQHRVRHTDAG